MISDVLVFFYLSLNIISFAFFALDKYKAIKRQWRISERTLLALALLGPFGAMLSMSLFRHKIRDKKFVLLIPFFILIHILYFKL